jgi:hypothetical protein
MTEKPKTLDELEAELAAKKDPGDMTLAELEADEAATEAMLRGLHAMTRESKQHLNALVDRFVEYRRSRGVPCSRAEIRRLLENTARKVCGDRYIQVFDDEELK